MSWVRERRPALTFNSLTARLEGRGNTAYVSRRPPRYWLLVGMVAGAWGSVAVVALADLARWWLL